MKAPPCHLHERTSESWPPTTPIQAQDKSDTTGGGDLHMSVDNESSFAHIKVPNSNTCFPVCTVYSDTIKRAQRRIIGRQTPFKNVYIQQGTSCSARAARLITANDRDNWESLLSLIQLVNISSFRTAAVQESNVFIMFIRPPARSPVDAMLDVPYGGSTAATRISTKHRGHVKNLFGSTKPKIDGMTERAPKRAAGNE